MEILEKQAEKKRVTNTVLLALYAINFQYESPLEPKTWILSSITLYNWKNL